MTDSTVVPPHKRIIHPARKVESGWFLLIVVIALIVILVWTQPDLYGNMLRFISDGFVGDHLCHTHFLLHCDDGGVDRRAGRTSRTGYSGALPQFMWK